MEAAVDGAEVLVMAAGLVGGEVCDAHDVLVDTGQ
jgi:hypothetical protein